MKKKSKKKVVKKTGVITVEAFVKDMAEMFAEELELVTLKYRKTIGTKEPTFWGLLAMKNLDKSWKEWSKTNE